MNRDYVYFVRGTRKYMNNELGGEFYLYFKSLKTGKVYRLYSRSANSSYWDKFEGKIFLAEIKGSKVKDLFYAYDSYYDYQMGRKSYDYGKRAWNRNLTRLSIALAVIMLLAIIIFIIVVNFDKLF